jgi:hypothetical protein
MDIVCCVFSMSLVVYGNGYCSEKRISLKDLIANMISIQMITLS